MNWNELERMRRSAALVRGLASGLLCVDYQWREGAVAFLEDMAKLDKPAHALNDGTLLTTRQAEFLLSLRDEVDWISTYRGLSIVRLIEDCFCARADLQDDEDVEFISLLKKTGRGAVRRSSLGRLLRCCAELHLIEPHMRAA